MLAFASYLIAVVNEKIHHDPNAPAPYQPRHSFKAVRASDRRRPRRGQAGRRRKVNSR